MGKIDSLFEKLNNHPAFKITLGYICVGTLWILFSDELVSILFADPNTLNQVQTIKGGLFVLVTGLFLYFFIKIQFDQIRKAHLELASKNTFINQIYNGINCVIFVWNDRGEIVDCNQYFLELLGYTREEAIGQNWKFIIEEENREDVYNQVYETIKTVGIINNSKNLVLTKSGEVLEILWNDRIFDHDENQHKLIISFGIDVTKEREMEVERNNWLFYDKLTLSGNAVKLELDCNELIKKKDPFSMILADISKLNQVNNQFGIHTGDLLIQYVYRVLAQYFGEENIYRWHSGSFVVMYPETSKTILSEIFNRIKKAHKRKIFIEGKEIELKIRFGITQFPAEGNSFEGLVNFASYANLYAKRHGMETYSFFNEQIGMEFKEELEAEMRIRTVLDMNFLEIYMQPIQHLNSGEIRGAEALLRSYTPSFYYESIIDFIKIAERTGMIVDVDFWVIENVFRWIDDKNLHNRLEVGINLSAQTLTSVRLKAFLDEVIPKYKINPRQITLELTEHSVVEDYIQTNQLIDELKAIGFGIALDDFGSEYSSLKYLSKLRFDYIKIDKAFIDNIVTSKVDRGIVQGIIDLSKTIGLVIIAEGVEDEAQYNILKQMSCDHIQGYYLGKPEPANEIIKKIPE